MRRAVSLFFVLLLLPAFVVPTHASNHCQFVLGFATLREIIGHDIVGECLENQRYAANGNAEQRTTGGLMVWRKADNWTAFTDGYHTWINGPNGLQQRLNTERFEWEADYTDFASAAATTTLTRDALRNAEYALYQVTVRLEDGRLERKVSWSDHVRESWQLHDPIAFGDLNGDGVEDAAVVLTYNGGGSGTFYSLLAVRNENGAPVHIASFGIGDRVRLNALEIAAGVITVRMVAHGPTDGLCCPTQDTVATFRLNGNTLELLSEVPPGNLTAAAQRAARPSIDPARIDPGLAGAFQEMRNAYTEEIDALYDWFVASGARAQFGALEGASQFDSSSNLITINEEYRNESPEALAHTLIWPLAGLRANSARGGSPQSWDECIADRLAAHSAQALWWLGQFGANGKQDPTQLEQWANNNLASYLNGRLKSWVSSSDHYRQLCAKYGEPPPVPTATPSPVLVLPWGILEIDIANQLEKAGYNPRSASFTMFINDLSLRYGYLPHALFLAWLDAGGRGIEDATSELWSEFLGAFLFNQEFRRLSIGSVREYLEANAHLGPVLTALLKDEHIGSLDERIHLVARIEDASGLLIPAWMVGYREASAGCSIHCQHVKIKLRDYLVGKDLAAITTIPSPWPLYEN